MIDTLKVIDIFEYKGIQGFLHSDFSVSTIVVLPEYVDIAEMSDTQFENYQIEKANIYNTMLTYGEGNILPPIPKMGGSLYQFFQTKSTNITEELEIIKNSNKSKGVYSLLMNRIINEEVGKLLVDYKNLNKNKNYVLVRTYLSAAMEKKYIYEYKEKKYKSKNLEKLYTNFKLENNAETELAKEKFFESLKELFLKHETAVKKFKIERLEKTEPFDLKLQEELEFSKTLDILGQVNIIRDFYDFRPLNSIDINTSINFQIFNKEMELEKEFTSIKTGKECYEIYDKSDTLEYKVFEDENSNTILINEKRSEEKVFLNCFVKYDKGNIYKDEEGIYIIEKDLQANINQQIKRKILLQHGFNIKKTELKKYITTYTIDTVPDIFKTGFGDRLVIELNKVLKNKTRKFNITINSSKTPIEEQKAKLNNLKKGWGIINTLPSMKNIIYEKVSAEEKVEAYTEAYEMVRKGLINFIETQIFITVISYDKKSYFDDIDTVLRSPDFGFSCVQETDLGSDVLFISASPFSYSKSTKTFQKELLLSDKDFINLINLNKGKKTFSLETPGLIGISDESKINFINTYDSRIEAPNGVVIGSTGSGKSFTKTFELIKLLTYSLRPYIAIIDRGGSFVPFVEMFGGSAITLNLQDAGNNINPFVFDNEFKKAIKKIDAQNKDGNNNLKFREDIYSTLEGDKIYESEEGDLYIKDENGNYQNYTMYDVSPQKKLDFFIRILKSMSKSTKDDIDIIFLNILKEIILGDNKTFSKQEFYIEDSLIIINKEDEKKAKNENDLTDLFYKNVNEKILKTKTLDNGNKVYITYTYVIEEDDSGLYLKYNNIKGKEESIPNKKIYKTKKGQFFKNNLCYLTVNDVIEKLKKLDEKKYEKEINIMYKYVNFGVYGNLFEGPPVLNFDDELLWTIDMGEETPLDLSSVILQSLNILLWSSILHPKHKGRKKKVIYDEVHHILNNAEDAEPAEAIGYMYRTIRKHGGGIDILTQASSDIFKKETEVNAKQASIFSGIKANAMYKYLIGIAEEDSIRTQEDFQLTDEEIKGVVNFSKTKTKIASKRGLIYMKTKAFSGFINIKATPTIYAIATTHKQEKNLRSAIQKLVESNSSLQNYIKSNYLTKKEINNIKMIISVIIFSTIFPKGINHVYGENTEAKFLNKHINKQPDGVDIFVEGLKDYLRSIKQETLIDDIIGNEILKLNS